MQGFRSVIDECGFVDLGFRGFPFTWCNNRCGNATTWLRLDRFMATNDWVVRFHTAVVHHLDSSVSDHKPIWLTTYPIPGQQQRRRPFRFEDMWRVDPTCEPTITTAWVPRSRGSPMAQVQEKTNQCSRVLKQWSRVQFGNVTQKLKEKTDQLHQAEERSVLGYGHDLVISIRKEVQELLNREEKMWRQRSRTSWLKEGDRNTKYFHSRASHRRRRNSLLFLRLENGNIVTNEEQIATQFVNYYQELFTAVPLEGIDGVLVGIQPRVTAEMNRSLTCNFTELEVLTALKQMAPLKAPGPDGMPPIFYQSYWHVVGEDVIAAVLSCLNSGKIPASLNHSYVTLIPKTKSPEKVTEYRPISLCNVVYKLISKVLANRLKKVLPQVVSETQSAFVPGRMITDNVLIAFETLHHMHNQRSGKVGTMALKLDMSKAYDRVEWGFLKQVMIRMGFCDNWISLIMECISTVSYSLLINGEPTGHIIPTRGIRQGDPISPYLFLLCAEGLNGLLQKATSQGDIHGVSLCRQGPKITNLFFADDSLLFCRATISECQKIQDILRLYEQASGQQLNRAKTTLFFSRNTPATMQTELKDILGVPSIKQYEQYLGLPSLIGKEKIRCFSQIKERVWSKIKGWKEKLLSQAGREILIKAVVQAIPTYTMNCFKLPVKLCQDIEGLIRRFWWGQKSEQRKIHWLKWDKLCQPKGRGGLGFKELQKFNIALLAKQFWRLMHVRNSLLFKVFSAKFFPSGNIMEVSEKTNGSFVWRGILKAKELILLGSSWRVGDGTKIPIKGTSWLLDEGHKKIISPLSDLPNDAKVSDLIHGNPPTWNSDLIRSYFLPYDADAIAKIPLSDRAPPDRLIWHANRDGHYIVRSGYHTLLQHNRNLLPECSCQGEPDPLWKSIWASCIPAKVKSFLWKACHEALPTKAGLFRRRVIPHPYCDQCHDGTEDTIHALWSCPVLAQVWQSSKEFADLQKNPHHSFISLVRQVMCLTSQFPLESFAMACWLLWNKRNQSWLQLPSEEYGNIWPRAQTLLLEHLSVSQPMTKEIPHHKHDKWKPPTHHLYKANFDGAFSKDTNSGGIGVVIRDQAGLPIATLSQKLPATHSIEITEALAARRAILFAKEVGLTSVVFEGDAENIIRDLWKF
uniref:Reverse transcriptase domain-containing protein n=1 Tax=Fagus sylvatica TaxID=28930 RepID=A0A2N9G161_FAGSY